MASAYRALRRALARATRRGRTAALLVTYHEHEYNAETRFRPAFVRAEAYAGSKQPIWAGSLVDELPEYRVAPDAEAAVAAMTAMLEHELEGLTLTPDPDGNFLDVEAETAVSWRVLAFLVNAAPSAS